MVGLKPLVHFRNFFHCSSVYPVEDSFAQGLKVFIDWKRVGSNSAHTGCFDLSW